jgi:FMN-dependent NADH-azoreductase
MYNFTIPAVLGSRIDYVIRPGFTFRFSTAGRECSRTKRRLIVVSRDTGTAGEFSEAAAMVTPVLRQR